MTGELHEISRLFGQLESKLETVLENQRTSHTRLSAIEAKIASVETVANDHADMKKTVERHDTLVNRGIGFITAVSVAAGALGVFIQKLFVLALAKFGAG